MEHNQIIILYITTLLLLCKLSETQNPCISQKTCGECVQISTCAWCMQPDFGSSPRCFQPNQYNLTDQICSEEYVYNPDNLKVNILAREITKIWDRGHGIADSSNSLVMISPQRVNFKLRLNQENQLSIRYAQIEDFPFDLYYLKNLPKSMDEEKEKLNNLENLFVQYIPNISRNYKFGVGSFKNEDIEITHPKNEPCQDCDYKNVTATNNEKHKFDQKTEEATLTVDYQDVPQRDLNMLFQTIVCTQKIGWRQDVKKLVVYGTATGFHYAESGQLRKDMLPNDGECHLDKNGLYTHPINQNYPTISQINQKVRENFINIIFAVSPQQIQYYMKLSHYIEGSSVGVLSSDSSNVLELIREHYSHISATVEMKDNATEFIKITYESSCLGNSQYNYAEKHKCEGVKIGDIIDFKAKITATYCPENQRDRFNTIEIYPLGTNKGLIIDVELFCDCPCERIGHPMYEELSKRCNEVGTFSCGNCECDDSHYGKNCECSKLEKIETSELGCRSNNSTSIDCSGRGTCICGRCECEYRENPKEIISGKFCECDNFSCDRHNQEICSGLDHGKCECGVCVCEPGWTRDDCSCRSSTETCVPPGGQEICSGHGKCECGFCVCRPGFRGFYCETS